ncbi:MAG: cellulase family glycosylhydrolase [Bacteroidia bacterium]|nr:cellulase family glycosylhydrolase [Bacteroidia bacterium]
MKYTNILKSLLCGVVALSVWSCGDDKEETPIAPITFVSSDPANGAKDVDYNINAIKVTYSEKIHSYSGGTIKIEGGKAKLGNITLAGNSLNIPVSGLESKTTYTLTIPENNIKSDKGQAAEAVTISFTTKEKPNTSGIGHSDVAGMELGCKEIWQEVKVGLNLGNTLESYGAWDSNCTEENQETLWGNPKTTKEMVDAIKAAGFNAMRIPVRWYNHSEEGISLKAARAATTITIKERWLARVKEIVDYCIANDMYVILNTHHDNWYDRINYSGFDEAVVYAKFESLWKQIASYFAEYDQHLIFAGMNEVIFLENDGVYASKDGEFEKGDLKYKENWGEPTKKMYDYLNKMNQVFVDAVRSTGGKNEIRNLVVQSWACDMDKGITGLVIPQDKVEGRLSVEFHYYQPWDFASTGNTRYTWGNADDLKYVDNKFDAVKAKWFDKGYGVVMGEYGACYKYPETGITEEILSSRKLFHEIVLKKAKEHGFPGFYWDNGGKCLDADGNLKSSGGNNGEIFALFDRYNNMKVVDKAALEGIMAGAETAYGE